MEESNPSPRRTVRSQFGNGQRLLVIWLITLLIPVAAGHAIEESSVIPPEPEPDEAVVELPPFQVSPTEGWVAQDTFSGTRLRTPFRDLANQIETLTTDFMDDFALNTFEEATIYTINVESRDSYVDGLGYENSVDGGFRIRGLDGVENNRMFFMTFMPPDRYNQSRIDISSGPNSVLSASRGHAGSVNSDPVSALFTNGGHFGAQFDSFGSMRFELDLNQVLIDDTLAIRGAFLYLDGEYDVKPSYNKDRRLYGTLTYRPFRKTEIRAYYEYADLKVNQPPKALPYDQITQWFEASLLPDSGYTIDQPIFQNDPEWVASKWTVSGQNVYRRDGASPVQTLSGGSTFLSSWVNSVEIKPIQFWPHVSSLDRNLPTLHHDSYFPTDINLSGDTCFRDTTDQIFNLVLNQQITEGLYLEIAGHSERLESFNAMGTGEVDRIEVDGNAFLPDGVTPNPNVGRFYIQGQPIYDVESKATDQARLTLAYEYDFAKNYDGWGEWLGRHRLTGVASIERSEVKWQRRFYCIVPEILPNGDLRLPDFPGASLISGDLNNYMWLKNASSLFFRHYLDPSIGQMTATLPFRVGEPIHLIDSAGVPFTVDPENTGFFDEDGARLTTANTNNCIKWKEDAYVFTYQGYFWDDRVILTYGRRGNNLDSAPFPWENIPPTNMVIHSDDTKFRDYEFQDAGSAEIAGIVLAPLRDWVDLPGRSDLSLYYQQSSSFQPKNAWFDPYGNRYAGSHGEGEDAGIRLSLAEESFSIRINYFRVSSGPERAIPGPYQGIIVPMINIETRVRELDPDFLVLEDVPGLGFFVGPNGSLPSSYYRYAVMNNSVSTGYEISGNWTVNENLEFRFNVADQDVVRSDLGTEWWEWMDERLPTYQSLDVPEGGVENPRDMDGDGTIGRWTWETAWLWDLKPEEGTLLESWEDDVIKGQVGRELIQALEGRSDPFIRKLRLNVNGMYRFTEGPLKGLRLGGAFRWREAPLLSHGETAVNGYPALDISERHYGTAEWYIDLSAGYQFRNAWLGDRMTTVGLNVRNALNHDDPVPFLTDVNGDPVRMMRVEGIKFILSLGMEL